MGFMDVIRPIGSYLGIMDPKRAKLTLYLYDVSQKEEKKPGGNVDKTAEVNIAKPVKIGAAGSKVNAGTKPDVKDVNAALNKDVKNLANNVAGKLSSSEEPGKVTNGPSGKKDGKNYSSVVFNVMFNPESLEIKADAGGLKESKNFNQAKDGKNATGATESITYMNNNRRSMQMSVKLLFDKTDENHAFSVLDPFSISLTGSTVKNIFKNVSTLQGWDKYSVKEEVEGLLASIQSEKTSHIKFEWGDMSYEGVFYMVDAEYTMFNPDGSPCRANVFLSMTIIDSDLNYDCAGNKFKDALEKEFKDGNTSWNTFNNKAGTFVHW